MYVLFIFITINKKKKNLLFVFFFKVSIYPELNSYINDTLDSVKSIIKLKKLRKLDICFYNKFGVAVERFVFNILNVELDLDLSDFS